MTQDSKQAAAQANTDQADTVSLCIQAPGALSNDMCSDVDMCTYNMCTRRQYHKNEQNSASLNGHTAMDGMYTLPTLHVSVMSHLQG